MATPIAVVVLAAGRGTRMRSARPKVLQPLGGRSLLAHTLETAAAVGPQQVSVVYGFGGASVPEAHRGYAVRWVEQPEQLGTGHAVACALPDIPDDHRVLVLYGDVPLVRPATLQPLIAEGEAGVALLTAQLDRPAGYGRVVRRPGDGGVEAIVEEKDATPAQRAITEVNTGLLAAPAGLLRRWLAGLSADNAQGEYYLTDIVAAAVAEGVPVTAHAAAEPEETSGINDLVQLAEAERIWQARTRRALMRAGLRLADPERVTVRGRVEAGYDCSVDPDVLLEGEVVLGDGVHIGPGVVLRDARVGDRASIDGYSVIEGAEIGPECRVGPFAHLRRGSALEQGAKVGNFVETKAAHLGPGAKANHLSYVGDAEVGARANIGAGTITCNYDGAAKHKTAIGADAFIGSGTELVAPVRIGDGATIGAGTTISRDAPAGALTVARRQVRTVAGWQRPGLTPQRGAPDDDSEAAARPPAED